MLTLNRISTSFITKVNPTLLGVIKTMNLYYILIIGLKNQKFPQIFDLLTQEPIVDEQNFKPYYKDICSDHNINPKDVMLIGLEEAKFVEDKHNYVLVVKLKGKKEPITFDIHTDELLATTQEAIEKYEISNVEGAFLHKLRPELLKRKL